MWFLSGITCESHYKLNIVSYTVLGEGYSTLKVRSNLFIHILISLFFLIIYYIYPVLGGGDVYVWVGGAIEGTAAGPMPYLKGLNDIQWHSMIFNDIQCEGEGVWRWRWVSVSGYVTVSAVDTVNWLVSHRCTHVSKKVLYSECNCEDKNDYNEPSTYTARMRYLMNMIIMSLLSLNSNKTNLLERLIRR